MRNITIINDTDKPVAVSLSQAETIVLMSVTHAATQMLAALQMVVAPECIGYTSVGHEYIRDNESSRAAIKAVRAAIAKATGAE